MPAAATKIYVGPKSRGHSSCVYVKSNTARAFEQIKRLYPELEQAGTTDMLDFLTQQFIDAHAKEIAELDHDVDTTARAESHARGSKRQAPAGKKRKGRLGLPS